MGNDVCEHVYTIIGKELCPSCGRNTHETDWEVVRQGRKEHREQYGILYQAPQRWWSI